MIERSESAIALTIICCRRTEEAIPRLGLPLVTEQKKLISTFPPSWTDYAAQFKTVLLGVHRVYIVPETNR